MLGLADREASECRRCGWDLHETLDYDWRWIPEPPAVCLRCAALAETEKAYQKHPQRAGLIYHVRRAPRPKPKPRRPKGA